MIKEFLQRVALAWRILVLTDKSSNLVGHVKREIQFAEMDDDRGFENNPAFQHEHHCLRAVVDLVRVLSSQGHSGLSVSRTVGLLGHLSSGQPLTPLTGAEAEWAEVGPGVFQNRRCSSVFRENGHAYDIDGFVFVGPDGISWTNGFSRRPIHEWPYQPSRAYVRMEQDSLDDADYEAAIQSYLSEQADLGGHCTGHTVH